MHSGANELFELFHSATGGCLLDNLTERLWQITMFGEVDRLIRPQAVLIEAWHIFERNEGGIAIDAAEVTDFGERPLDGFRRTLELFGERSPIGDTVPPELPDDLGFGSGKFHGRPPM
jgi:hypothetical protein